MKVRMKAKTVLSPARERLFGERIQAIRAIESGVPQGLRNALHKATVSLRSEASGSKAQSGAIEVFNGVAEQAREEVAALKKQHQAALATLNRPKSFLLGRRVDICRCTPAARHFSVPFKGGSKDSGPRQFLTPANAVYYGYLGWSPPGSDPVHRLSNVGDGTVNDQMALGWSAVIPRDGVYMLDAREAELEIYGNHTVSGHGWSGSDYDAEAEIDVWIIVYLDNDWLWSKKDNISFDRTKSENRTKTFGESTWFPGTIMFQATAGQELGIIARAHCNTWTSDEGAAEIEIDLFGLIANTVSNYTFPLYD